MSTSILSMSRLLFYLPGVCRVWGKVRRDTCLRPKNTVHTLTGLFVGDDTASKMRKEILLKKKKQKKTLSEEAAFGRIIDCLKSRDLGSLP